MIDFNNLLNKVGATSAPTAPTAPTNQKATLTSADGRYKTVVDVGSSEASQLMKNGWKLGDSGKTVVSTSNGQAIVPKTQPVASQTPIQKPSGALNVVSQPQNANTKINVVSQPQSAKATIAPVVSQPKTATIAPVVTQPKTGNITQVTGAPPYQTYTAPTTESLQLMNGNPSKVLKPLSSEGQAISTTPEKVWPGGFIGRVAKAAYNTAEGTIKVAVDSLGQAVDKIGSEGIKLSDYNKIALNKTTPTESNQAVAERLGLEKITPLKRGVAIGQGGVSTASLAFLPVMMQLEAAKELPGILSVPAKAVSWGFEKMGQVGVAVMEKSVAALPISDEDKETITPLAEEVGAFVAQMLGIKAVHGVAKKGIEVKGLGLSEKTKANISAGAQLTAGLSMTPFTTAYGLANAKIVSKVFERKTNGVPITKTETKKILEEIKTELASEIKIEVAKQQGVAIKKEKLTEIAQKTDAPTFERVVETTSAKDFLQEQGTTAKEFYEAVKPLEVAKPTETITLYRAAPKFPSDKFDKGTYFADTPEKATYYSESHYKGNPSDIKVEKFTLPKNSIFKEPSTGNYITISEAPVAKPTEPPAISKDLQPLAEEARKYKSAEEFSNSVLYHGSPESFSQYDLSRAGLGSSGNAFGTGAYFTDKFKNASDYASGYGNVNAILGGKEGTLGGKVLYTIKPPGELLDLNKFLRETKPISFYKEGLAKMEKAGFKDISKDPNVIQQLKKGVDDVNIDNVLSRLDIEIANNSKYAKVLGDKYSIYDYFLPKDKYIGAYDLAAQYGAPGKMAKQTGTGAKDFVLWNKGKPIKMFETNQEFTKSQLTDIWNKANATLPKKATEMPPAEVKAPEKVSGLIGQEKTPVKTEVKVEEKPVEKPKLGEEFKLTPEQEKAIMEEAFGMTKIEKDTILDPVFYDLDMGSEREVGYQNFKKYVNRSKDARLEIEDYDSFKNKAWKSGTDGEIEFFSGASNLSNNELFDKFKERYIEEQGGLDALVTKIKTIKPGLTENQYKKIVEETKNKSRKLYSQVFERLKAEGEQGIEYNEVNLRRETQIATELIIKDKQRAYNIAMGAEKSADVTSTAVNITMAEKALAEGDIPLYSKLVKNRSLEQTRRGQEIVSEKASVTDNSVSKYVKELISTRLQNLGNNYLGNLKDIAKKTSTAKEKALNIIEKKAGELGEKIKNKKLDVKTALSLLEKITCV